MNKLLGLGCILALTSIAGAGSIRVENSDSKSHTIKLKCSGSDKTVEIDSSKTSTYTFHSTSNECEIVGGSISFPTKKLLNGQKWKIKDGKASAN